MVEEVTLEKPVLEIYHHWDGYPENLGKTLLEQYNDYDTILNLLLGGDASTINNNHVCQYCAWRGEDWEYVKPKQLDKPSFNEEYLYKFENGVWTVDVETTVINSDTRKRSVNISTAIIDANGTKTAVAEDKTVAADEKDKAVITSGIYQRNFKKDGKTYHHIMDKRTGMPADNRLASVTVIADDGEKADALATALSVMGEEKAKDYQKKHPEIEIILIRKDGNFWQSAGAGMERQ